MGFVMDRKVQQDVAALELKVYREFKDLLCKISKGYRPDYEFLMQEISLIENIQYIDDPLFLIQYYLNND